MNFNRKNLSSEEINNIKNVAIQARANILMMTSLSNSGHPGGSMSSIDLLLTLYKLINIDPKNPKEETRDMVVVSNGHISPAVYSTLGEYGFFNIDEAISQFRLTGSIYEGHIEPDVPGVELATGNLGQGLSAACGFALSARLKNIEKNIFVIMGDGEQQKGQISEARRFAVKFGFKNITVFIDYNQLQINGNINEVMPQNIKENFISDGWEVLSIDGHNIEEIQKAIFKANSIDVPVMILANTTMGKGISFMENKEKYHGSTLSEEQLEVALNELNVDNRLEEYKQLRKNFKPKPLSHKPEYEVDIKAGSPIIYEKKTDNRSAWGNAITDIAKNNVGSKIPLAIFDCDLKGSVKLNDFHSEFPKNFFQSGIMEHNTATVAGTASRDGVQSYYADFGVFGADETYNQHRLNDINNTNLKIITTHVGLDVGEDGKTHQCIDYLGLMRNLYHFKTIVPSGPNQTDRVIRYISEKYGNFFVPMGRSKLNILKDSDGKIFFGDSYSFEYGKADLLREGDKAALFVMGTLCGRAVEVADKLSEEGIKIQVWNVSCPEDLDEEALKKASKTGMIFSYEDHNVHTGLGSCIANKLMEMQLFCKLYKFGVENYAMSGNSDDVFKKCNLDTDSIINRIKERI